jgi:hypothetical protein
LERRAVTGASILRSAADNLEFTYLSIGRATPGAIVSHGAGYSACVCEFGHAVGNFAIVRGGTRESAKELLELAEAAESFNIYSPPEAPESAARHLRSAGFEQTWRLSQLVASGKVAEGITQFELVEDERRLEVARYMADQFFFRQKASVREVIAKATAHSGLELLRIVHKGSPVGAVMIAQIAGLLGVYNLCIEADLRGRGFGSEAMKGMLALSARRGCDVVLQCDVSLVPWYSSLGFREAGSVDVYGLGKV